MSCLPPTKRFHIYIRETQKSTSLYVHKGAPVIDLLIDWNYVEGNLLLCVLGKKKNEDL